MNAVPLSSSQQLNQSGNVRPMTLRHGTAAIGVSTAGSPCPLTMEKGIRVACQVN